MAPPDDSTAVTVRPEVAAAVLTEEPATVPPEEVFRASSLDFWYGSFRALSDVVLEPFAAAEAGPLPEDIYVEAKRRLDNAGESPAQ